MIKIEAKIEHVFEQLGTFLVGRGWGECGEWGWYSLGLHFPKQNY